MFSINFHPVTESFSDTEDGECEACGIVVAEVQLRQCQLGFCGRYLCSQCVQFCASCFSDVENRAESLFVFCRTCAMKVCPQCSRCARRLCRECTDFIQCKAQNCSKKICSDCQLNSEEKILTTGKCSCCCAKQFTSLQGLCKNVIRMSIATAKQNITDGKTSNRGNPTMYINETVRRLEIPRGIQDILLV